MQVRDRRQQVTSQTILSDKSVNQVQGVLRNIRRRGEQDDGSPRPEPPHFDGNFLPVHFGHDVFDDYNVNRVCGSQFKSLGTISSS